MGTRQKATSAQFAKERSWNVLARVAKEPQPLLLTIAMSQMSLEGGCVTNVIGALGRLAMALRVCKRLLTI